MIRAAVPNLCSLVASLGRRGGRREMGQVSGSMHARRPCANGGPGACTQLNLREQQAGVYAHKCLPAHHSCKLSCEHACAQSSQPLMRPNSLVEGRVEDHWIRALDEFSYEKRLLQLELSLAMKVMITIYKIIHAKIQPKCTFFLPLSQSQKVRLLKLSSVRFRIDRRKVFQVLLICRICYQEFGQ